MKNDIYLIGEVGYEITLDSVINQVENSDKSKPLNVNIHSQGGSVYDGLAIYNYFKNLDQEVNTSSSGLVASIASIIFLAGNKETRKINKTDSFLIHLPMGVTIGNAEDFEKNAKELREIENKLVDIYVNETNISREDALALMNKDEMLDVNFLKEKGFVNKIIEFKAVANLNTNKQMNLTEEKVDGLLEKFYNKFFKKEEPTNKIVQDANGVEIDFFEVEEDSEPVAGDKARIDGTPADGEYVMPNGQTWVFVAGTWDSVIEVVEDNKVEELEAELVTVNKKNTELTNSLAKLKKEFTELKNTITSSFESKKMEKKEEGEKTSRTFRNKK